MDATEMPLCRSPLNETERARLLRLLDALAGYLGAPGDWGYSTQLGRFTINVLAMQHTLRNFAPAEGGDA